MKKSTINAILIAIITIMSVSICFLIFCIMTRPRYVIIDETEPVMITEASSLLAEDIQELNDLTAFNDQIPVDEESTASTMHGKTSTRVNIRDAASENARVLATVDEGTAFDIIEIQDNGWTKILYENTEAYISSKYVILTSN